MDCVNGEGNCREGRQNRKGQEGENHSGQEEEGWIAEVCKLTKSTRENEMERRQNVVHLTCITHSILPTRRGIRDP